MTTSVFALLALFSACAWLARKGYLRRRKVLERLDLAVRRSAVDKLEYAFSDDTATTSIYRIEGEADGVPFRLEAKETRACETPFSVYALHVPDRMNLRGGYGYGEEHLEGDRDQVTLALLFLRLWPNGDYPRPAWPRAA